MNPKRRRRIERAVARNMERLSPAQMMTAEMEFRRGARPDYRLSLKHNRPAQEARLALETLIAVQRLGTYQSSLRRDQP